LLIAAKLKDRDEVGSSGAELDDEAAIGQRESAKPLFFFSFFKVSNEFRFDKKERKPG